MKLSECPQLIIYVIFTLISFSSTFILSEKYMKDNDERKESITTNVIGHLIGFILMCALLWYLCSIKYFVTAWVILLLPIIALVLIVIFIVSSVSFLNINKKITDKEESFVVY